MLSTGTLADSVALPQPDVFPILAGVLISNWNQIVQFLKQIALLQSVTT